MARLGFPRPGFFIFYGDNETQLSCIGGLDVGNFHVEVEGLSRQRVVEVDHDSLLFNFMDAHGDRFPLGAFRCQHRSYFLRLRRELVFGNFLKGVWVSAITVFGLDDYFFLIAHLQSRQLLFKTRNDLSAAVKVGQRLLADIGIDDFPGLIGESVFDGNKGAFLNSRGLFTKPGIEIFLKMDIEGAEQQFFTEEATSWLSQIREIMSSFIR